MANKFGFDGEERKIYSTCKYFQSKLIINIQNYEY